MKRNKVIMNRLLVAAPWITLGALFALSVALPNRTAAGLDDSGRKAEIAQATASVPRIIGRWVSTPEQDGDVPRAAQKLLKPNAISSRRYVSPAGWVNIVFVHCSDARDMIGHFPPICYPSGGWSELPAPPNTDHTLTVRGMPFPVREYGFMAYGERGRADVIRIFNAFILPDGVISRDIDDINRQSERLSVAVQGVAQVQVITPGLMPLEEAMGAAEEILNGMNDLLAALKVGSGALE